MPSPTPISTSRFNLDPGPQPRRRVKLGCRSFLWMLATLAGVVGCYFTFYVLRTAARSVTAPHYHQFQDLTVPYKTKDVVRPLVDSDQSFDIVATVWIRKSPNASDADVGTATMTAVGDWGYKKQAPPRLIEEPIFSDTVFRNHHLRDKIVKTAVNLSIPTEIFKNSELWNYDLRASFVLVPSSPGSLLKHAMSYSTWIQANAGMPPMRPFSSEETRTMADAIVDSYGILVPMLEFHPVPSKCNADQPSEPEIGNGNDDDGDDIWDVPRPSQPAKPQPSTANPYRSTKSISVVQAHPYVVTRTHIRVVDMTAILNRKAYDVEHRKLSLNSCGGETGAYGKIRVEFNAHSWVDCRRAYGKNGNMETRIKLRTTDESGANVTEWAYAPYMDYANTAGPLDVKPVPVSREKCLSAVETSSQQENDEEVMNVTWNIAFSGRSPGKFLTFGVLAEALLPTHEGRNMSATEYDMFVDHKRYSIISGLFGHRYHNGDHPRLNFLAFFIAFFSIFGESILDVIYWYSRSSTVGISITGTTLHAFGSLIDYILDIARDAHGSQLGLSGWAMTVIFRMGSLYALSAIWMLVAITRAEVRWMSPTTWIPALRIGNATHAERANRRVDERTPHRYILMAYAVLSVTFVTLSHFDLHIISSSGLKPPPPSSRVNKISVLESAFVQPAITLGRMLQLIMNFRTHKFSGAYKLQARLSYIAMVSSVVVQIVNTLGQSTLKEDLNFYAVIYYLCTGALAWQALFYPSLLREDEVEE